MRAQDMAADLTLSLLLIRADFLKVECVNGFGPVVKKLAMTASVKDLFGGQSSISPETWLTGLVHSALVRALEKTESVDDDAVVDKVVNDLIWRRPGLRALVSRSRAQSLATSARSSQC